MSTFKKCWSSYHVRLMRPQKVLYLLQGQSGLGTSRRCHSRLCSEFNRDPVLETRKTAFKTNTHKIKKGVFG